MDDYLFVDGVNHLIEAELMVTVDIMIEVDLIPAAEV